MTAEATFSVRTLKALGIDNIKINEVQGNNRSNITRGQLEVCYSPEYDRFLLSLNSFKYMLSPNFPVIAFLAPNAYRSYIFPTVNGFYILKMKSVQTPPIIQNFETILANYTQFSYKTGQEVELDNQAKGKGDYPMVFGSPYDVKVLPTPNNPTQTNPVQTNPAQTDSYAKAGNAIHLGGEFLKQKIIKAADYLGKTIESEKKLNANELNVKSIQELKQGDYPEKEMIDFTRTEFEGMITLANQIEKGSVFRDPNMITTDLQPQVQPAGWEGFKKTTADSAKSLWRGMDEAAGILSNAFKKKKKKEQVQRPAEYQNLNPNQTNVPNFNVMQTPTNEPTYQPQPQFQPQPQPQPQTSLYGNQVTIPPQQYEYNQQGANMYGQTQFNQQNYQQSTNMVKPSPNENVPVHAEIKQEPIQQQPSLDKKLNIYPSLDPYVRGTTNYYAPTIGQPNPNPQQTLARPMTQDENIQTDFLG